jgi:tetratricopeptide (TPR) repeat protein
LTPEVSELDRLFSAACEELRRLAASVKRGDGGTTLSPTGLVNEAWVKLKQSAAFSATSLLHFKRIAARAMRQVLVDAARQRHSKKRGRGARPPGARRGPAPESRRRSDKARAYFNQDLTIYRKAYPKGDHYLVGLALANLGSVYLEEKRWTKAEPYFRRALATYAPELAPDHLKVGVARIWLGRALFGQKRSAEAHFESLAGYQILAKQANPAVIWLEMARQDLANEYLALGEPGEEERFLKASAQHQ